MTLLRSNFVDRNSSDWISSTTDCLNPIRYYSNRFVFDASSHFTVLCCCVDFTNPKNWKIATFSINLCSYVFLDSLSVKRWRSFTGILFVMDPEALRFGWFFLLLGFTLVCFLVSNPNLKLRVDGGGGLWWSLVCL